MVRGAAPLTILMADDNPGDVGLVREALRMTGRAHRLVVAEDGEAALAALKCASGRPDASRPDLLLLDLNLPRVDGWAVLRAIRATPDLVTLPIIVLSGSAEPQDVTAAYALGANAYVTKPLDLDLFLAMVSGITAFWGDVAALPGG